jgi:hypothetical protein
VKTHKPLRALASILFLEGLLISGVALWLFIALFTENPTSYTNALAILVLVTIAAIWVLAIAVNTIRGRPWVRAAAITWQILQIAVAIGFFQGIFPRPDVGWALLLPAIAVIILLFVPSVVATTKRNGQSKTSLSASHGASQNPE